MGSCHGHSWNIYLEGKGKNLIAYGINELTIDISSASGPSGTPPSSSSQALDELGTSNKCRCHRPTVNTRKFVPCGSFRLPSLSPPSGALIAVWPGKFIYHGHLNDSTQPIHRRIYFQITVLPLGPVRDHRLTGPNSYKPDCGICIYDALESGPARPIDSLEPLVAPTANSYWREPQSTIRCTSSLFALQIFYTTQT
jgi:hypothetical protein